jgi:serine/threonine protein kinase
MGSSKSETPAGNEWSSRATAAPGVVCENDGTEQLTAAPAAMDHPEQIGPYRILGLIGGGGMGLVYQAEQRQPVRRIVAIKLIKLGMDTREVIARFEAERQALALMDHPNIARVFDAGSTEAGRPYFVMEYVAGDPINVYCDKHNLDTQQRLELFVGVCEAVQHAHQKAIIHRDLKPSNILVTVRDAKPLPKVIDFGVAKATNQRLTEKTMFTEHGQLIGTAEYMSPEQAEMSGVDVDTRSDIYSLGVLLYELLSGTLPFDGKTLRRAALGEIQRIIREVEPPRPSTRLTSLGDEGTLLAQHRRMSVQTLAAELRRELEWIPLKAMRKDRTERYRTATEMADDIRNYLAGRPLVAGPVSTAYRARKFIRRNARPLAGITVALLVVIATVVGAFVMVTKSRNEERIQRQLADRDRKEAEANFEMARNAVNDYFVQVSQNKLLQYAALRPLRNDLLGLAATYYQKFVDDHANDPALQKDLAQSLNVLGDAHRAMGRQKESIDALEKSLAIRQRLLAADPKAVGLQRQVAQTQLNLASALVDNGQILPGTDAYQTAIKSLEQLTSAHPDAAGATWDLAMAYHNLATTFKDSGRNDDARKWFEKALDARKKLVEKSPADTNARSEIARTLHDLATLNVLTGKNADAVKCLQDELQLRKKLVMEQPDTTDPQFQLARCYGLLSSLQQAAGDAEHARESEAQALKVWTMLTGDPRHFGADPLAAEAWGSLGYAQLNARQYKEAVTSALLATNYDPSQLWTYTILAHAYLFDGQYAKAEPIYLAHKDEPIAGSRTFAEDVLNDFDTFRKAGITAPGMEKIEQLLRGDRTGKPRQPSTAPSGK